MRLGCIWAADVFCNAVEWRAVSVASASSAHRLEPHDRVLLTVHYSKIARPSPTDMIVLQCMAGTPFHGRKGVSACGEPVKSCKLRAGAPEPPLGELQWTVAVARLLFGPAMNIQAPPNLTPAAGAARTLADVCCPPLSRQGSCRSRKTLSPDARCRCGPHTGGRMLPALQAGLVRLCKTLNFNYRSCLLRRSGPGGGRLARAAGSGRQRLGRHFAAHARLRQPRGARSDVGDRQVLHACSAPCTLVAHVTRVQVMRSLSQAALLGKQRAAAPGLRCK